MSPPDRTGRDHRRPGTPGRTRPTARPLASSRFARLTLVAAGALLLAACGDDDGGGAGGPTTVAGAPAAAALDLPGWLEAVQPGPDGSTAERSVEVEYGTLEPRRELRVLLDGVDVTSQLEGLRVVSPEEGEIFPSPGQLRYDAQELVNPLAPLEPGQHEAAVQLVEVPEFGARRVVLDEYGWTFQVQ